MANDTSHTGRRLEPPDVATRTVLLVAGGIIVFVGLSLVGLKAYYEMEIRRPLDLPPTTFPEPRLQIDDAADRIRLEREQRRSLQGYAWVDRDQGIIRVPIGEAMKHIIARGADAYAPLQSMPAAQPPENPAVGRPP